MEKPVIDSFIFQNIEQKKIPRKISFKCRKSTIYHHTFNTTASNTNMVTQLASIFNEIDKESKTQQPGYTRLIKRINSYKATQVQVDKLKRTMRKPSVKMKPMFKSDDYTNKQIPEIAQNTTQIETRLITGSVRAAIENFEKRSLQTNSNYKFVPKPIVPSRKQLNFRDNVINEAEIKTDILEVQTQTTNIKSDVTDSPSPVVPNTSFLWRKRSQELHVANEIDFYEIVDIKQVTKSETTSKEQIHEDNNSHYYESCRTPPKYEDLEDSTLSTKLEDVYETIPFINRNSLPPATDKQQEPLPPRPMSWTGQAVQNSDDLYESIYALGKLTTLADNYESIYEYSNWEVVSNQGSLISDQKSNSLYERAPSACSTIYQEQTFSETSGMSDKSDEWIDVTDNEDSDNTISPFVVIRAKPKSKTTGWTQKIRDQWIKTHLAEGDANGNHHYETLHQNNQYLQDTEDSDDSFESDTEAKNLQEIDINNLQLPDPPSHGLSKLAVSAGKHMKRLRKNWSLTKSDITKSFIRMRKKKSVAAVEIANNGASEDNQSAPVQNINPTSSESTSQLENVVQELKTLHTDLESHYSNENKESDLIEKRRSDGFLNKFRRSISVSNSDFTQTLGFRAKSTFYLTDTIDVDRKEEVDPTNSGIKRNSKAVRPHSPPPPIPVDANQNFNSIKSNKENKRSTSWYAEVGLFKNSENIITQRPNTSWYAEIGLYHTSTGSTPSTPNTNSQENSGNTINSNITPKQDINEEYYNLKNETDSTPSLENYFNNNQLRLQDEPLYQFYDAALFDDYFDSEDFDSDGYEEVQDSVPKNLSNRPSAMELILPNKNGVNVTRTLWCEIPEVLQSSVLSTLSTHQKKIQEAKFEMITSEASYLNSLNVLWDHFVANLNDSNLLSNEEKYILFGKIRAVKRCSKHLLSDMEKCWQDNILLYGICDIVKKHVESNFIVYVPYCENQILLDSTLRKIRDRTNCNELLRQLENSPICQSLTLYSFLLLPMQRITRWPLLIDAVLKRLSPEDSEYITCQNTLAALNKIVAECNEAARKKEQETEIRKISQQIEFPKNVPIINIVSPNRWLIRSGPLVYMQARIDDIRLTFGKRFSKLPINLFLFNDLLIICKPKSDGNFTVMHYCFRSYIDLNADDLVKLLPVKETQGRNLIFLTLLENHEGKMVEMLLSCSSESDKERWIEALSQPKSDDPNEILYDCWDCPQVTAVHTYNASQPDELGLNRGDVVNIDRKMADGWYHGERLRDGQVGWFPGNYTVEIANPHVRARNLKQRYRFLALSQNYLKTK